MKIDIPIEIGDPILKVNFDQHDGYFLDVTTFNWGDIPAYQKGEIFTNIKEAKERIDILNSKHSKGI